MIAPVTTSSLARLKRQTGNQPLWMDALILIRQCGTAQRAPSIFSNSRQVASKS